ncbi:MAG TPA: M24 family metallopeptidase, partial [Streptosporangiaceae bacterium]|nr:M24 family metallopeptidase [Streptosporangiaceae bacterium]
GCGRGEPWCSISGVSPGQALEFSAAEMRRRRAAFGRELDRSGASYGLVYGANRSGSAVSWLTGWPVTREALLLVAPEAEDDVLLVSFFNHVPQARRLSATRVEWSGARAVATALDLMAARGRLPARIGVAGALPFDQYRLLAGQVPDVVDLNPAYTGLRLVKSGEELAALRRGAALSDAAIAALADALRPGVTDYEVLARTEQAYTAQGGLHHIHYLGLTAMDEPALAVPAQWPTGRVIRPRDVASCEISAAAAPEYAGQVLRTFTVGAPPTALYRELHAVAAAAFDAIAQHLIPGTTARDLAAAAAVVGQAGFTAVDDLVHGFGGGYLPPVVPAPGRPLSAPDFTLAAGMTVVVQPNVVTRDGQAGVQTGELLLVTEQGPERLHAYPPGLQQLG